MREVSSKEALMDLLNNEEELIIYVYTPLCGTCKLARNFLKIMERIENIPVIHTLNINLDRDLGTRMGITSVPCLMYINKGEVSKLYAFESVTKIYKYITSGGRINEST